MKTLELKLKKDVLIVEVDKSFNHFKIYDDEIGFIFIENSIPRKELIKGSYKFLCKGSELTEEIASELVDKSIYTGLYAHYVDEIPVNTYCYNSAIESFISGIESKKFHWLENPIEKPNGENYYYEEHYGFDEVELLWDKISYNEDLNNWQESEEKTFRNPLIFVKK